MSTIAVAPLDDAVDHVRGPATGRLARIARDVDSGEATRQVRGTPTLIIDGVLHRGGYDAAELLEALGAAALRL